MGILDLGFLPKQEKFNIQPLLKRINRYSYDISGQFVVTMSHNSGLIDTKKLVGFDVYDSNSLIKSVNIDNLNFSEIREWIGSSWSYTPGNHELQQVEIEFRDINGGVLYSNWKAAMLKLKNRYPEEQQWTMTITKLNTASFRHLDGGSMGGNIIVNTKNAILRGISGERLDSEDSSFTNFTITFFFDPFPFVAKKTSEVEDTSSTTFG